MIREVSHICIYAVIYILMHKYKCQNNELVHANVYLVGQIFDLP